MHIEALSFEQAQALQRPWSYVLVSIVTPGAPRPLFGEDPNRLATVVLEFHDVDERALRRFGEAFGLVGFTEEMARMIWYAIRATTPDGVVAHCEAGISRSAGVAAACAKILNGDDQEFFNRKIPNPHVYHTMLRAWTTLEGLRRRLPRS